MKLKSRLLLGSIFAAALAVFAGPAAADPITDTLIVVGTWITANAGIVALALTGVSTLLGLSMAEKAKKVQGGIKTSTSTGGSTSQTFIMGTYATGGHLAAPLMSYGVDGKTPNAYLTMVISLGCMPGHGLSRLIINDKYYTIGGSTTIGGSGVSGNAIGGDLAGNAWIIFHDGTQTAADALLREKFGSDPDRPWTVNMIGKGNTYAVLVFRYNRDILNTIPTVRFEMTGIPLYDPRKDTTVGGSGSHRWGVPATYEHTRNNVVMIYNIHRGIVLPDGAIWGGEAAAEDLPLDNWFTGMNECDVEVDLAGGGTEPQYESGTEISLSEQPADVMERLMSGCNAQQIEIGGVWKIRVGGPALPSVFFTDEDILVDHDDNQNQFPSLEQTYNGIQANHPLPESLWTTTDAPARYNTDWEAEDDGRRLIADISLPTVFSPTQVQRIMQSSAADNRRFRRHGLSMGPYASALEPLDSVAWTSPKYGYTSKVFEITQSTEGLLSINMAFGLRERDSADFDWDVSDELPWVAAPPGSSFPVVQTVPGFTVTAIALRDTAGNDRRPAIQIEWDGDEMPDVRGLMWEIRLTSTLADVAKGTVSDITAEGVVIADGILPDTEYDVRAQLIVDRPTAWTSWVTVETPDIRFGDVDLADEVVDSLQFTADEILKNTLRDNLFRQVQSALNYDGDGNLVKTIALEAIDKSDDAIQKLILLGAVNGTGTAFVFNLSTAQIVDGTPFSSYITGVQTQIDDNVASITDVTESVDGLSVKRTIVANVNGHVTGLDLGVDGTTGHFNIVTDHFRLIDPDDSSTAVTVFEYVDGEITLRADVKVLGSLGADTITTDNLVSNAAISPDFAERFDNQLCSTDYITLSIDILYSGLLLITGNVTYACDSGHDDDITTVIRLNSGMVITDKKSSKFQSSQYTSLNKAVLVTPGTYVLHLDASADSRVSFDEAQIVPIFFKKTSV